MFQANFNESKLNSVAISIIMPAYNAQDTISDSIEAIIAQKFTRWELIVINDGSVDRTEDKVLEFADSRIKYFSQLNKGPSSARNAGLEKASGQYITFVDADDSLHPEYLSMLYSVAEKKKADIVMCSYKKFDRDKFSYVKYAKKISPLKDRDCMTMSGEECTEKMYYKHFVMPYPYLKMIKRDCIGNSRFSEELKLGEDLDFNCRLFERARSIIFVNKILYYHLDVISSITHNLDYEVAHNHFMDLLYKREKASEGVRDAIDSRIFVLSYDLLSQINNINDSSSYAQEYLTFVKKYKAKVLKNHKISSVVKALSVLSFFSVPFTIRICKMFKRVQFKKAI